jgi:hypothetical protein
VRVVAALVFVYPVFKSAKDFIVYLLEKIFVLVEAVRLPQIPVRALLYARTGLMFALMGLVL